MIERNVQIGYGSFAQIAQQLEEYAAKRILLVTGKRSFEQSGAAKIVQEEIGKRIVGHFTDFEKNPTISDIEKGVTAIKQENPDLILAVGGGSALDVAKQMNICARNSHTPRDYITAKEKPKHPGLPLVACPTTAGTGSEATHFAVCYDGMDKYSFADPKMKPNGIILDPALASSLPPYQAACCAVDALSQLIESFWAVAATDESRSYSEEGLSLLLPAIKPSILEGNRDACLQLAQAAYLSGKAIDISKTTAAHALSYPIAQIYGLPHGHAVAMTLPELIIINSELNEENCAHPHGPVFVTKVIQKIGKPLHSNSAQSTAIKLNELINELGIDRSKEKLGLNKSDQIKTILAHVNLQRLGNNPRKLDQSMLYAAITNTTTSIK